ncbi:MAG: hypothetical protein GC160_12210 [Acidobacteria bacterium]|nr:hypothetical protein [Acidobacteriota bacterium]
MEGMQSHPLLRIVYSSVAVHPFGRQELLDLLDVARRNNAALDVTGMLLYRRQRFMQLLEGPRDNVESLYDRIEADPRHTSCRVLLSELAEKREFESWSMGFEDLDSLSPPDVPGLSDYLERSFDSDFFQREPSAALLLLNLFKVRV